MSERIDEMSVFKTAEIATGIYWVGGDEQNIPSLIKKNNRNNA